MKKERRKYAVVSARGLGDGLLSMVLAHNLALSGHSVTLFSTALCELESWFPRVPILPSPSQEDLVSTLSHFDTVIAADYSPVKEHHYFGNQLIVLKEGTFNKHLTMVTNLLHICKNQLQLPFAEPSIGISPPQDLIWRKYPSRVLLHPTSADPKKNWSVHKFVKLASHLKERGYSPHFCVSPKEAVEWRHYVDDLPHFPSVATLAAFIYESGILIGNDSGSGHLASSLHIPTLSIFARKGYARLWRPGWGPGDVVSPLPLLVGARLRQRYWTQLLSVKHVLHAFNKLREKTLVHPSLVKGR